MTQVISWLARPVALACSCVAAGSISANATDLYKPHPGYTYKDSPAIVSYPNWAGFYAGGHVGGGWRDGVNRDVFAEGGTGGGGGGGGGDNNSTSPVAINGADGKGGNLGGAGGDGGNQGDDDRKRIGGNGGDGGAGGRVDGSTDNDTALVGGIHLGFNWQHDNLVLGVEGDASLNGSVDDYLATLRARIGVTPQPDLLLYVTGGFAFRDGRSADAIGLAAEGGDGGAGGANDDLGDNPGEADQIGTNGGAGGAGGPGGDPSVSAFGTDSGSETGYVLGLGVDYMITGNVSAGFEGLWYSFDGDEDVTILRGRLTWHLDRSPHDSLKDGYLSSVVADWSGFYGGGNIGVGFGSDKRAGRVKTDDGEAGDPGDPGADSMAELNTDGFPQTDGIDDPGAGGGGGGGGAAALVLLEDDASVVGGFHIGYNWQDESLVFGLEGDANWGDESFRDYIASIRLRVGHAFDRVHIFGTAGIAFAGSGQSLQSVSVGAGQQGGPGNNGGFENADGFSSENDNGPFGAGVGGTAGQEGTATVTYQDGDDKIGFVLGGGFEVRVWDQTSFGVEGLYYGFDGDDGASGPLSFSGDDDLTAAIVRGRMTFHLQEERESLK